MNKVTSFLILFFASACIHAQIYIAHKCKITFFSAAPIENITAVNKDAEPVMSTATRDIQVRVPVHSFVFRRALMQEHFNEDYMESDKFPYIVFKGKINEKVNFKKDGTTHVTVTGVMNMHGVKRTVTIKGTITVKNGVIFIQSNFNVRPKDYHIKVPTLLNKNLAESLAINITAEFTKYKGEK